MPRGNIYLRGVVFEARAPTGTIGVILERRSQQLGYGWTGWSALQTWNISNSAWDVYQDQGNLSGYYDNFEYRLKYYATQTNTNTIRNIYLTVTRTTK